MKNGMCQQHRIMSTKINVTRKVWKDRGAGRGYGYVSKKVSKRICRARNTRPVVSQISTMSDSVSHVANSGMKGKVTSDGRLASGDRNTSIEHENNETGQLGLALQEII